MHWRVANLRARGLLDHDEAISLLAAAGKSPEMDRFYQNLDSPQFMTAGDLQSLMRPTGETGPADVCAALQKRDIHPPLYFLLLHAMQRAGIESRLVMRLTGTLLVLLAAGVADRLVWRNASAAGRLLGFSLLTAPPVFVMLATELRQYAFVLLGMLLSIAALQAYWEQEPRTNRTLVLLIAAPAILLWSHLGSALWVALCLAVILFRVRTGSKAHRRLLAIALPIAMFLIAPLVWLQWDGLVHASRVESTELTLTNIMAQARHLLRSLGLAWFSLPARWWNTMLPVLAFAAIFLFHGSVSKRGTLDRLLPVMSLVWFAVWVVWLASGRIPPHAGEAKYLLPLLLGPLVVLVKSTARPEIGRARHVAIGMVAIALLTHFILFWRTDMTVPADLNAIRNADCLVVDQPKRGYWLPVVDLMPPDATVVVASAEQMNRSDPVEQIGTANRLLLLEIDTVKDGRRTEAADKLRRRLAATYEKTTVLREGPHRTITEFKHLKPVP